MGVLQNIHNAMTYSPKDVLLELFQQLQKVLQQCNARFYVTHNHSHSSLPGPLTFGNNQVDQLVAFASPEEDHAHYHSNAGHLHIKYKIPYSRAKQIVEACPICRPLHLRIVPAGVNPQGLQPNELWQMDVTHIASLGCSSYVHVTLDTYSKFLWATALTGETSHHVISHLIETFAVMGIPAKIKTDNDPAYTSNKFKQFCEFYDIKHITVIEYNPQGQAMIERAHGTLKLQIKKKLKRRIIEDPGMTVLYSLQNNAREILHQDLFILNFLNLPQGEILTRAEKHFEHKEVSSLDQAIWLKLAADMEWQPGILS